MAKQPEKLKNYINVLSDFQFSINLEYDLYSDQKIKNYIPTVNLMQFKWLAQEARIWVTCVV